MVPGRCLCGSAVLAAMATLAPSRAARSAMARPMPRLAPVTKRVLPARLMARLPYSCASIPDHAGGVRNGLHLATAEQAVQVRQRLAGGHAEQFRADGAREQRAEHVHRALG